MGVKRMKEEEILYLAKKVIIEEIEKYGFKVIEIILFGSRARGDYKENSDWDFYVIVDQEIDFKIKKNIIGTIQMNLAEYYIFCDILINSLKRYNVLKNEMSTVSYISNKEGLRI